MSEVSTHPVTHGNGVLSHHEADSGSLLSGPTSRSSPSPRRRPKSEQTLAAILKVSFDIALRKGVFNLTLGDVAEALNISKSGVFLRAGSLEALQLLVIKEHEKTFFAAVFTPSIAQPRGLPRLESMMSLWMECGMAMSSLISSHYAACEADPRSPDSPPRDYLIDVMRRWRLTLRTAIEQAVECGHLKSDTDPYQLCFELFGLMSGYIYDARMVGDPDALLRGKRAYARLLSTYRV